MAKVSATELVKDLRSELREARAEIRDLQDENDSLKAERQEVLEALGLEDADEDFEEEDDDEED